MPSLDHLPIWSQSKPITPHHNHSNLYLFPSIFFTCLSFVFGPFPTFISFYIFTIILSISSISEMFKKLKNLYSEEVLPWIKNEILLLNPFWIIHFSIYFYHLIRFTKTYYFSIYIYIYIYIYTVHCRVMNDCMYWMTHNFWPQNTAFIIH